MATPRRSPERSRDRRPVLAGLAIAGVLGLVLFVASGAFGLAGSGAGAGASSTPGTAGASSSPARSEPGSIEPGRRVDADARAVTDADPDADGRAGRRRRRAGHPLPLGARRGDPGRDEGDPGGDVEALRHARGGRGRGERDLRRPRHRAARRRLDAPATSPRTPTSWPSTWPTTATGSRSSGRTPSAPASMPWPGARTACSGSVAVEALADWPLTRTTSARPRPTPSTRPTPGPSWPAATSCSTAASTTRPGSRSGASTSRSTGATRTSPAATAARSFGWELPGPSGAGGAGAVRDLVDGADLAIANFENPAPDKWRFHDHGTAFSAEPAKIEGLAEQASTGCRWPTTTSATPAARASSQTRDEPREARDHARRRRQGPGRGARAVAAGGGRRRPSRSSPTTRSPRATRRRPSGPAAPR